MRPTTLFYCVKSDAHAAFLDELRRLLGANLKLIDSSAGRRLDIGALFEHISPDTLVYLCGPLSLMNSIQEEWSRRGWPPDRLRFESFANSGRHEPRPFDAIVADTGARVTVETSSTLLDALLDAGHEVMFGCRKGACGLCKVEIVSVDGEIDHRDVFLGAQERLSNQSLCACVSRVFGREVTIRIDRIHHGRFVDSREPGRLH